MADSKAPDQIVISAEDACGASNSEDVSTGDTLLPMLIASLVIAIIGGVILALIYAV